MSRIVIDMDKCGSCHLCELACSFHHFAAFSPRRSSLEVRKHVVASAIDIKLHETSEGLRKGCDGCASERIPLCVQWCPTNAISVNAAEVIQR